MVTLLAVVVNTTRAVEACPRATPLAVKPCCGLHDSRKAPVAAHWATTVPPDELRTVPLVLAVPPDAPVPPELAPLVPLFAPVLALGSRCRARRRHAATSLACACTAAATLDCWLAGEAEMPSPSSETTIQAACGRRGRPEQPRAGAVITMRVRMLPESRVRR